MTKFTAEDFGVLFSQPPTPPTPDKVMAIEKALAATGLNVTAKYRPEDLNASMPASFELRVEEDCFLVFDLNGRFDYAVNVKE